MKNITISSGRSGYLLSASTLFLLFMTGLSSCDKETKTATVSEQLAITNTTLRGSRGSVVTITGTNLALDAEVYYRGTLITTFEPGRNTTGIKFKVPADAIDGEITLKQDGQTLNAGNFLVTNCWQSYFTGNIDGLHDGAIQFAHNNKIYWGFGYRGAAGNSNAIYSFDIATKEYRQVRPNDATQPGAGQYAYPTYGVINGTVFIYPAGAYAYNIASNSFTPVMGGYNAEAPYFVYNNKLHYYYVGSGLTGQFSSYNADPSSPGYDTYAAHGPGLPGNSQAVVEVIGDTAYIIGGYASSTGNARSIIAIHLQNFGYTTIDLSAVMTWSLSRRFMHFQQGNVLYFGGGYENGTAGRSFYSFDVVSRQAKKLADIPQTSTTVPSAFVDGKAYIVAHGGVHFYRPQ